MRVVKKNKVDLANLVINIFVALACIGIAWIFVSWIDIISHNLPTQRNAGQYFDWNFFVIMLDWAESIHGVNF